MRGETGSWMTCGNNINNISNSSRVMQHAMDSINSCYAEIKFVLHWQSGASKVHARVQFYINKSAAIYKYLHIMLPQCILNPHAQEFLIACNRHISKCDKQPGPLIIVLKDVEHLIDVVHCQPFIITLLAYLDIVEELLRCFIMNHRLKWRNWWCWWWYQRWWWWWQWWSNNGW